MTIYGVSGSYAETYAADNGIAFVEGRIPGTTPAPTPSTDYITVSGYKINNTPTEITVQEGDTLTFAGTLTPTEGATISAVQVSIYDTAVTPLGESGAQYFYASGLSAETYDISNVSGVPVGTEFGAVGEDKPKHTMTAGNTYAVMLYASDSKGKGLEDIDPNMEEYQGPYILVHVVAPGETTWYADVTDEAGNALAGVTLPYTGEYAGKICVRTNNGDMTAWVTEGFPFELVLESVELQDDGSYLFTYAISAPLDMTSMAKTDTVYFCLRDENGVAITDAPLAQVTVTQEGNPDIARITIVDASGRDLTKNPFEMEYTGAVARYMYVTSTHGNITAWQNGSSIFKVKLLSQELQEDGTYLLTYQIVVEENPYAIERTDIIYFCMVEEGTTQFANPLTQVNVIQEKNPNTPIVSNAALDSDGITFHRDNPLKLIVGDHNYSNGFGLIVNTSNSVLPTWTVYTDDTDIARAYRKDGLVYVHAKGCGTTGLYISHIYAEDYNDVSSEMMYKICDIEVSSPYNAIVIADPTYRYFNGMLEHRAISERTNESDAMIKFFLNMRFDDGTSVNTIENLYTKKSYYGTTVTQYVRDACAELSTKTSSNSVTFVYILCHGDKEGNLIFGLDASLDKDDPEYDAQIGKYPYSWFTLSGLKSILDQINGRVVLLLGSCYSGQAIDEIDPIGIKEYFDGVVNGRWDSEGVFRNENKYFVITAADDDEPSHSVAKWNYDETTKTYSINERKSYDIFTMGLCNSLSWDYVNSSTPPTTEYSLTLKDVHDALHQYVEVAGVWIEREELYEHVQMSPAAEANTVIFERVN